MMSYICKIFTCKSKKQQIESRGQVKVISSSNPKKTATTSIPKPEYKQVKRNKKSDIKEVIENIDFIYQRVKFTIETDFRYIVPVNVIEQIFEMIKKEEVFPLDDIQNLAYLSKNKRKLHRNFKFADVCLVTREVMDCLIEGLEVDYIIQIQMSFYTNNKIKIREVVVFMEQEFLCRKKEKIRNFDRENNLDKGILFGKELKVRFEDDSSEEEEEDGKKNNSINNSYNNYSYNNHNKSENSEEGVRNSYKDIQNKYEERSINEDQVIKVVPLGNKKNKNFIEIKNKINSSKGTYVKKQIINENSTPSSQLTNNNNNNNLTKTNSNSDKSTNMNVTKKSNFSLISKLGNFENLSLFPKGLYNPSVYCFMNTCMQCLLSIPELNYYFSSDNYKIENKGKKGTPGCNALKEFVEAYGSSSNSLKPPQSLYKVCHSFLEPNQQHDCQEFLRRFLTKIQEELNPNKKYSFPDKTTYEKVWSIYREANPSFVDTIFSGLMRSSVICNKCGYKSDTYDPFLDLSVPIKKKPIETLNNCLSSYFGKEFIDCEYKCSSCKKKTSISKKLEIVISPPVLTIHFKRFEDLHHKYNGSIEFTDTLELLTYTSQEVHETLQYELFAVAVHLGRSIFSGHYVAYAKRNGKARKIILYYFIFM